MCPFLVNKGFIFKAKTELFLAGLRRKIEIPSG